MGQITLYNCSPAPLSGLTVNGVQALKNPIAQTNPIVSYTTLATGNTPPAFSPFCTIAAYFDSRTTPQWTASIHLKSSLPVQNYSLWCYFNGLYLADSSGVIIGSFYQLSDQA